MLGFFSAIFTDALQHSRENWFTIVLGEDVDWFEGQSRVVPRHNRLGKLFCCCELGVRVRELPDARAQRKRESDHELTTLGGNMEF